MTDLWHEFDDEKKNTFEERLRKGTKKWILNKLLELYSSELNAEEKKIKDWLKSKKKIQVDGTEKR